MIGAEQLVLVETTEPTVPAVPVPPAAIVHDLTVPPLTDTEVVPPSSVSSGSIVMVNTGYAVVAQYWYEASEALGVPPSVCVASSAVARTDGTNAEPKSPASKPAVVTAVTSLFLRDH